MSDFHLCGPLRALRLIKYPYQSIIGAPNVLHNLGLRRRITTKRGLDGVSSQVPALHLVDFYEEGA